VCFSGLTAIYARRRGASGWVAHLLALAQTLLVAQVGLGLILLAQHKHAADRLHYAYGSFALLAVFAPWLYAPRTESAPELVRRRDPSRRRTRCARIYDRDMRISPFLRGMLIIAGVAVVVVVLNLETASRRRRCSCASRSSSRSHS